MNQETQAFIEYRLLSTAQLSRLTGIPEVTIKQRAYRGHIDFVKKGGVLLFDRYDFQKEIQAHEQALREGHPPASR